MRIVLQRVLEASVKVYGEPIGEIEKGYLIFVGIEDEDTEEDALWLAQKVAKLRLFADDEGKMNLSLTDIDGSVLVVSQFTLHASTKKGNRPSFIKAGKPAYAEQLYHRFQAMLAEQNLNIQEGEFGADMQVSLVNDGPVTLFIDSKNKE